MLDISGTSQDTKLGIMIDQVSGLVASYLGYPVKRADYTSEKYAINNRQYLQLRAQPIQAITSVTLGGTAVTDYGTNSDDLAVGLLYYGPGWSGRWYARNLTNDPVGGVRDIEVSYTAGWYLPGDAEFVADDPESLPQDIITAAMTGVIERYRINESGSEGLKAHSEGGISDTYGAARGLSETVTEMLAPWRRVAIA